MTAADDALDLLERLRVRYGAHYVRDDVFYGAEDALATVRDELQRLREQWQAASETAKLNYERALAAQAELQRLRDERDEARETLALHESNEAKRAEAAEAEVRRLSEMVRGHHRGLAAIGGGPCVCDVCSRALLTDSPPSFQGPTTIQTSNPFGTAKLASPPDGGGAK